MITVMKFFGERELPAPPLFFGLFAFGILMLLLYLVMRLDRD